MTVEPFGDVIMLFTIIASVILMKTTNSSLVLDGLDQKGIYVSNYCPKMKYCPEGSHVMCTYYNPSRVMGPACTNAMNVSMTTELAEKLLDMANAARSKLALGKEKGKDGAGLPRAYGMFRLKWDNELATFAQVMANQCVFKHDLCRATKRFSDPGQTAGIVRFTIPDWLPVYNKSRHFPKGLTNSKLMYSIEQHFKTWYIQKKHVNPDMITNYPDPTHPMYNVIKMYTEIIHGPATHMGCGLSAFTDYVHYTNNAPLNYNIVQIFCNFSSRPHRGLPAYNTEPPTTPEFTMRCGCPEGSNEDDDCLCNESPMACLGANCNPTVVLLPIFTVEDAPPQKLISSNGYSNSSFARMHAMDMLDFGNSNSNYLSEDEIIIQPYSPHTINSQTLPKKQVMDVKNRYFDKKFKLSAQKYGHREALKMAGKHVPYTKKQSIFARSAKFELGQKKSNQNILDVSKIKRNVLPQKDFMKVQKVTKTYLNKNRNFQPLQRRAIIADHHKDLRKNTIISQSKIDTDILHTAEDNVINDNEYLNQNVNNTKEIKSIYLKNYNVESDNKLINLLDNLKKEVQHLDLNGNVKQKLGDKIRKIYGTVVGKPVDQLRAKETEIDDFLENDIKDTNKNSPSIDRYTDDDIISGDINKDFFGVHTLGPKVYKYSQPAYNKRPITRSQHTIDEVDNRNKNYKRTQNSISNKYNALSSFEDNYTSYGLYNDEINTRKTYLTDLETDFYGKNYPRDNYNKKNYRQSRKYADIGNNDDILSADRRRYYQEKLERLERRLRNTRNYKHRNDVKHENGRQVRPVRPTAELQSRRIRSKNQIDSFYVPDRARFLHGF